MLLVQMNILAELSTFQLESKATFQHCKEGASSQQMSLKRYLGHTHMEENWNLEKEMSLSARGEKLNLSRRLDSQRLTCCGTPLNPAMLNRTHNAKKTYSILSKFSKDPKWVKYFLKTHPDSPNGFSSSQWECIIKGKACDLDIVNSSYYHASIDQERKASIGEQEISIAVPQSKRPIRTSSEWNDAWSLTARAIRFAFPNRADELFAYEEHIKDQFRSKKVQAHHKVIRYDTAVRNKYQGGFKCLLSDTGRFQGIYSATLFPDGVEDGSGTTSGSSGGFSRVANGTKTPVCRRFNSDGGCRGEGCRYQHVCASCGKSGHRKGECNGGSK